MALSAFFKEAVTLVPAALSYMQATRKTGAEKRQAEAIAQQQATIQQALDPNSEVFKRQASIEQAALDRSYAKSIAELVRTQRRQLGMGRSPLLDPERADEQLSRLANEGYMTNAQQAQLNARDAIVGMANSQGAAASAYGQMVPQQQARLQARGNMMGEAATGIVGALQRYWDNQNGPRIQQATPDPNQTENRRVGGYNMADTPILQKLQRGVSRGNQGGSMLG